MLSTRHLAAAAAILGALALLSLLAIGVFTPVEALATGAFLVCLAALGFLVLVVRRMDGRTHRIDLRVKKNEAGHTATATALKRIEARLDTLGAAIEETATRRNEDLAAVLASLGEDRVNAIAHAREVERLREEVRALGSA
ncbi:hypothetical protein OIE66_32710 [Nonomuraea sp. NBC_01738]|uniref:hypothetical protein n=1 Tax=Nonomuraea sp. NBC_01738 TaxID=2976003 RepID=UPI002E0D42D5|nr:hypothetical protein OIE66_32710 [Nonomuraea sp. NBC_01738]